MGRNKALNFEVQRCLFSKLAIGQKRHIAKIKGVAQDKIFSYSTYHNYLDNANRFVNYCKENYNCKTLNECEKYVNDYIQFKRKSGATAYTQKAYLSALGKLYNKSYFEEIETDARSRTKIVRGRIDTESQRHFSEKNNHELVNFCKNTGLRRKELETLKGGALLRVNGKYCIKVLNGKGGKKRIVPILNQDKATIEKMLSTSNEDLVFKHIHSKAPIHEYRGDYAREYYNSIARDTTTLSSKEKYFCRRDMQGQVYDKKALGIVSKALGHNRENVVVSHYLY